MMCLFWAAHRKFPAVAEPYCTTTNRNEWHLITRTGSGIELPLCRGKVMLYSGFLVAKLRVS